MLHRGHRCGVRQPDVAGCAAVVDDEHVGQRVEGVQRRQGLDAAHRRGGSVGSGHPVEVLSRSVPTEHCERSVAEGRHPALAAERQGLVAGRVEHRGSAPGGDLEPGQNVAVSARGKPESCLRVYAGSRSRHQQREARVDVHDRALGHGQLEPGCHVQRRPGARQGRVVEHDGPGARGSPGAGAAGQVDERHVARQHFTARDVRTVVVA